MMDQATKPNKFAVIITILSLGLATNLGLAGAFQAGLKYAYRHDYDCAIQFDADGQHLPEYIDELRDAVKTYDIATAHAL